MARLERCNRGRTARSSPTDLATQRSYLSSSVDPLATGKSEVPSHCEQIEQ